MKKNKIKKGIQTFTQSVQTEVEIRLRKRSLCVRVCLCVCGSAASSTDNSVFVLPLNQVVFVQEIEREGLILRRFLVELWINVVILSNRKQIVLGNYCSHLNFCFHFTRAGLFSFHPVLKCVDDAEDGSGSTV